MIITMIKVYHCFIPEIIFPGKGFIRGGLREGTDVLITGRVPSDAIAFSFSICEGQALYSCPFHISPRFKEGCVVRNNMQNGHWGEEERAVGIPFRTGVVFDMRVQIHQFEFKVFVNNRHFCDFENRMPKVSLLYVSVQRDVRIDAIQLRESYRGSSGHIWIPEYEEYVFEINNWLAVDQEEGLERERQKREKEVLFYKDL